MKHFRNTTFGHPVVMGRATFDSIGRPLPGRQNIVLSRNRKLKIPGVTVLNSKRSVLNALSSSPTIMIIGGNQIFNEFYMNLTKIELTHIHINIDGDAFFHLDPRRDWKIEAKNTVFDDKLGAYLDFKTYTPDTTKDPYLNQDVKGLLRTFGSGKPIPGAGAAAALEALLSAYLILTVISIWSSKNMSDPHRKITAQFAYRVSSSIVPTLRTLFLEDIRVFDEVMQLRLARDANQGHTKGHITRQLNLKTHEATKIPSEVFTLASELFEIADFLYENGYRAVRGDSGAAMSSAHASMLSSVFVMSVNAQTLARSGATTRWGAEIARCSETVLQASSRIGRRLIPPGDFDRSQISFGF